MKNLNVEETRDTTGGTTIQGTVERTGTETIVKFHLPGGEDLVVTRPGNLSDAQVTVIMATFKGVVEEVLGRPGNK